jgi:hypothetical protein
MTPEQWAQEAARVLAIFHRAGLLLGLVVFAALGVRKRNELKAAGGPFLQVLGSGLAGYAIPNALFPLYWIALVGRPVSDMAAATLEIYAYTGAAVTILTAIVGIRESW